MGNINATESDIGNESEIGCVAVQSRCEKRMHWIRSEDSQQLQCLSESELQRYRTLQLPITSSTFAGMPVAADPDTFHRKVDW